MTRLRLGRKDIRQKREPARLAGKLDAGLLTYAIAASAAGIGMMAAQAAEAEVVASPANISIPENGGVIQFDINHDGQMDFGLSLRSGAGALGQHRKTCVSSCFGPNIAELKVVPAQAANEVWQSASRAGFTSSNIYCGAALAPGQKVGPAPQFKAGNKAMFWTYQFIGGTFRNCRWQNRPRGPYLGVKFLDTSGNLHYGWVRVSVNTPIVTITGYAYETTPNKPILTGVTHGAVDDARLIEPADLTDAGSRAAVSLGMLALGAQGLAAWRRPEEEQQAA